MSNSIEAAASAGPDVGAANAGLCLKVIGVGGAGINAVEHMRPAFPDVAFLVAHTEERRLAHAATPDKLLLGAKTTRGLGAAGDPECGREAAEQEVERLRAFCRGAQIVFVVAGMGRGTGAGASPVIARVAREAGALVLGIATLPFEWEGPRRLRQGQLGLRALQAEADAVICLPNQKVFKLVDQHTSVGESFRIINDLLAEGVRGIWRLLTRPGLLSVSFSDLGSVVRGSHSESSFAIVEAAGETRAREVVEKLLAHPLLDGGQALSEATALLVSVAGGPNLTMAEVNRVMAEVNRQCGNAHLVLGVAIDESWKDKLAVTVVASRRGQPDEAKAQEGHDPGEGAESVKEAGAVPEFDTAFFRAAPAPRPVPRFVPPAPDLPPEKKEELLTQQQHRGKKSRKSGPRLKQSLLPLEIIHKGRFAKSEPTIHDGEDLDVPTYIRRGVPLN
ncbi:MAG: hypothetical protein HYY24_29565 [Verrucomicrobia bacterium]|nr:hypothetical protein [Verrucomicrobiota bacterium]